MMKIILIALEFPPLNTAGSVRPFRMANELAANGADVTVLTMSKDSRFNLFAKPNNLELSSSAFRIIEINPSHPARRSRGKLHDWFSTGDYYRDVWGMDVLNAVESLISESGLPQWVMGTCPPFSTGVILEKIHDRFNIPCILDLRDAWSQWNINPHTTYFHYRQVLIRERRCIQSAALTLTTSDQTRIDLLKLHGEHLPILTVENGYDVPIEFPEEIFWKSPDYQPIAIGYVGSFYFDPVAHKRMHSKWHQRSPHRWFHYAPRKEDWTYRSPQYFFLILKTLFKLEPSWKSKIKIEFIGHPPHWLQTMIREFEFEDIVKLHGQVSLSKSLEIQTGFDFFLGTSAKIQGQPDYSMGSKYFESLQFLKPIIAVCGSSPLEKLVSTSKLGIVLDPDAQEVSARSLRNFFKKGSAQIDRDFLLSKSRKHQVQKLISKLI